jgi:hypothetical protein
VPVTGKPVSATEERKTVQTLGDGTVIERSDSNLFYRDSQGRTRVEQTVQGKTTITIMDPVARFNAQLDPASRTAARKALPPAYSDTYAAGFAAGAGDRAAGGGAGGRGRGGAVASTPGVGLETMEANLKALTEKLAAEAAARGGSHTASEDLGMMNQNGVPAQGTRTTMTIPVGQIGNNREIKVVNERWYSNELQMLVKSVNSDPRFGVTTYQLTNILRANPDSGLFQIPADYTVQEPGGQGARGGVITRQ